MSAVRSPKAAFPKRPSPVGVLRARVPREWRLSLFEGLRTCDKRCPWAEFVSRAPLCFVPGSAPLGRCCSQERAERGGVLCETLGV